MRLGAGLTCAQLAPLSRFRATRRTANRQRFTVRDLHSFIMQLCPAARWSLLTRVFDQRAGPRVLAEITVQAIVASGRSSSRCRVEAFPLCPSRFVDVHVRIDQPGKNAASPKSWISALESICAAGTMACMRSPSGRMAAGRISRGVIALRETKACTVMLSSPSQQGSVHQKPSVSCSLRFFN